MIHQFTVPREQLHRLWYDWLITAGRNMRVGFTLSAEGKGCSFFSLLVLLHKFKCQQPADRSHRFGKSQVPEDFNPLHVAISNTHAAVSAVCIAQSTTKHPTRILHATQKCDRSRCTETVKWLEKSRCLERISIYQNGKVADNNLECNYFNYYERLLHFLENIPSVLTQLAISAKQPFH